MLLEPFLKMDLRKHSNYIWRNIYRQIIALTPCNILKQSENIWLSLYLLDEFIIVIHMHF